MKIEICAERKHRCTLHKSSFPQVAQIASWSQNSSMSVPVLAHFLFTSFYFFTLLFPLIYALFSCFCLISALASHARDAWFDFRPG